MPETRDALPDQRFARLELVGGGSGRRKPSSAFPLLLLPFLLLAAPSPAQEAPAPGGTIRQRGRYDLRRWPWPDLFPASVRELLREREAMKNRKRNRGRERKQLTLLERQRRISEGFKLSWRGKKERNHAAHGREDNGEAAQGG